MIRQTYQIEIISPCFCAGAEPEKQAEIRSASIRGQLRWWFRVLGGFKSLAPMDVREQESMIFGSTAGDEGTGGKLTVRVRSLIDGRTLLSSSSHQAPEMQSPEGYLLFPLRNAPRHHSDSSQFELQFVWRGENQLSRDLEALATVFGNLGSLGFRSRRAMGALALIGSEPGRALSGALNRFASTDRPIQIFELGTDPRNSNEAIIDLANWLKSWRQHGRTQDLRPGNRDSKPPENPGFEFAKRDHDIGYRIPTAHHSEAFRPALGLPIIQRAGGTNNWEWDWNTQTRRGKGRFASPVILRPHRDSSGKWRALVIFVDAMQWPSGKKVFLNGTPRDVSLDLYDTMKTDPRLQPFP